jgi:glycosyltransferase involved in cell wall biosynthesis
MNQSPDLEAELGSSRIDAKRLCVMLVPDSIHWITGTIAQSIVDHNPGIEGTIVSGTVLDRIAQESSDIFGRFDLVHFVCPYASKRWLPVLRDRLPCVTSHHHVSDDWELLRHNLDGDAIIVGSSQWAADAEERGASPSKVVRVPYGVDASRFVPPEAEARNHTRESIGIAHDAIVLGFFAKQSSNEKDRKGTDVFASAVQALNQRLPNLTLLIIGPGWEELVAQLQQAGVRCVWLPLVKDSARMPEMYQTLDFYWVTARVEGGPVTLLEAMSTGVCCIMTPVGLANDIVESGVNGVLVPFDDPQAFVARTLEFAGQPAARAQMGACARRTILETMDVPVTSQGAREAYEVAITHFNDRIGGRERVRSHAERLPAQLLERIRILEELVWAEALMLNGQRSMALRIMVETWARYPLSSLPPRFLLRAILPIRLVSALVRATKRPSKTHDSSGNHDQRAGRN